MASSKCGHCGSHSIEVKTVAPGGSRFKLSAVQCASCGAIFGVTDFKNIGAVLEIQDKAIGEIAKRLRSVEGTTDEILRSLRR